VDRPLETVPRSTKEDSPQWSRQAVKPLWTVPVGHRSVCRTVAEERRRYEGGAVSIHCVHLCTVDTLNWTVLGSEHLSGGIQVERRLRGNVVCGLNAQVVIRDSTTALSAELIL